MALFLARREVRARIEQRQEYPAARYGLDGRNRDGEVDGEDVSHSPLPSCHETVAPFLSQYPEARIRAEGACMKEGSVFAGLGFAFMGTMVLLNNLGKPRIEAAGLHGSDILDLVASGMLFGVAIMALPSMRPRGNSARHCHFVRRVMELFNFSIYLRAMWNVFCPGTDHDG